MRETLVKPTWMEALSVNGGNGQSYGYIVYRLAIVNERGWQRSFYIRRDHIQTSHRKEVTLHVGSVLKIRGHPRDLVQVGSAFGYCRCLVSGDAQR